MTEPGLPQQRNEEQRALIDAAAMVQATAKGRDAAGLSTDRRRIIALAGEDGAEVDELSSAARLPLTVVQVLVTELVAFNYLHVCKKPDPQLTQTTADGLSLDLLESVLHGIASL